MAMTKRSNFVYTLEFPELKEILIVVHLKTININKYIT